MHLIYLYNVLMYHLFLQKQNSSYVSNIYILKIFHVKYKVYFYSLKYFSKYCQQAKNTYINK